MRADTDRLTQAFTLQFDERLQRIEDAQIAVMQHVTRELEQRSVD